MKICVGYARHSVGINLNQTNQRFKSLALLARSRSRHRGRHSPGLALLLQLQFSHLRARNFRLSVCLAAELSQCQGLALPSYPTFLTLALPTRPYAVRRTDGGKHVGHSILELLSCRNVVENIGHITLSLLKEISILIPYLSVYVWKFTGLHLVSMLYRMDRLLRKYTEHFSQHYWGNRG